MRFDKKVVVVTGAGAGMGKAVAQGFAAEGASIVAGEIDETRLKALVDELTSQGARIIGVQGNVANVEDCNKLIDTAKSEFGQLDILVNNAGIMDRFIPVAELTDDLWNRVVAVNLNGQMYTCRRAIPIMLEQGHGVIVNFSSAAGMGGGFAGAAYTVSKHGVIGLTRSIATMYAKKGIRCVAVCPGGVNTGMPLGGAPSEFGYAQLGAGLATMPRVGEPAEVANVVLFAASDEASFVNGAIIPVDGGWLAQG
jgi:NAD(P)-dependent dehydrogenase (short-subunit alcohol dehydrogenase family)